jgi:hypothetical protein
MVLSAECSSQQQGPGPICRYLYFLSANKKALAKFVKCVDWKVEFKAQQRMHVDCRANAIAAINIILLFLKV